MKKLKIDRYFLTRDAPIGKFRRVDMKKVKYWAIGFAALMMAVVLFTSGEPKKAPLGGSTDQTTTPQTNDSASTPHTNGDFYAPSIAGFSSSAGRKGSRQLSASQIVKPEAGTSGGLPSGTTIPARLINRVVTADAKSPVIAIVTQDVSSISGLTIPTGTKVLGNAQSDSSEERVQVTFHTLVFEDGHEQAFSALAVMPDGSAGLVGDYHSQILKKESGRFLGNFVSGFAEGFKDRQQGGFGMPYEPGNLKNALLGGVSDSAADQAKAYAEGMSKVTPYITVEAGTPLLLYLEKGLL
jgi:Bacterial conjugation TrbI-like protein